MPFVFSYLDTRYIHIFFEGHHVQWDMTYRVFEVGRQVRVLFRGHKRSLSETTSSLGTQKSSWKRHNFWWRTFVSYINRVDFSEDSKVVHTLPFSSDFLTWHSVLREYFRRTRYLTFLFRAVDPVSRETQYHAIAIRTSSHEPWIKVAPKILVFNCKNNETSWRVWSPNSYIYDCNWPDKWP